MRRIAIALLLAGCSSFQVAHRDSLRSLAAADFSCPREQVAASEAADGVWNAQGCGKVGTYKLTNPACIIERDCTWQAQNAAAPTQPVPAPPAPADIPPAPPPEPPR